MQSIQTGIISLQIKLMNNVVDTISLFKEEPEIFIQDLFKFAA